MGIEPINPFELPLLNTVILLSSGATITYAHHSLIKGDRKGALYGTIFTVILALVFTLFQGIEYSVSSFTISDGVFGTCFFFGTGLIFRARILFNKSNFTFKNYFSTTLNNKNLNGLEPYWVTGFSDGESSFSIRTTIDKSRKIPIRILPIFSIELHIRDIEVLNRIKNYFKVGSVTTRIKNNKETATYAVNSVKELITVIIPHFNKYPLITQKQADFILFTDIIGLINDKQHLTEKGLLKILSIKNSMGKGLNINMKTLYPNLEYIARPVIEKQNITSVWWLIGFVDAEGTFYIKTAKSNQVSLSFSISQHSRDVALFTTMKDFLDCGILEKLPSREEIRLLVYSLKDITQKILPLFENNNLISQKQKDFNNFKKVSCLMLNKEHLTEKGLNKIKSIKSKKMN